MPGLLSSAQETRALPETEALWYLSTASKSHRALLKHPVISSFLWLKWQRIRDERATGGKRCLLACLSTHKHIKGHKNRVKVDSNLHSLENNNFIV